MQFLMLMWTERDASGGDESDIAAWVEFNKEAREAGVLVEGAALEPAASAAKLVTTELESPGASAVEDQPFAPGDAQIQAYYRLECADMDEALTWAKKLPTYGRVEVRAQLDYDLG